MPPATVIYHWAHAPVSVINPSTFTEQHCDINLPEGATLRRLLLSQPLFWWKRGSVSSDDQQMYFVNYEVTYGSTEGAPVLYRSIRTLKRNFVVNPTGITEVFLSHWMGADLELGFNEKVQRGGFYEPPQRLRLAWTIYSTGAGIEVLAGQANVSFRALYSVRAPI